MENEDRINGVLFALNRMPHDQTTVGIGFKLIHDPTKCARCIAFNCLMQLGAILRSLESQTESQEEETIAPA